MSNSLAVAATTNAIRNLLLHEMPLIDAGLVGLAVTTTAPALARTNQVGPSVNVFLYRTAPNAAWRNQDLPSQVRPGETGRPPLALDLHYLLTFYAPDDADKDAMSHRVTAAALSVLHDHPVLADADLDAALVGNDTAAQAERVRLTPQSLTIAEMSELWTGFQASYRLSAGYQVTVLLIDSRTTVKAPLPVLRRGSEDSGPVAVAAGAPVLRGVRPAAGKPAARLGETVALIGDGLSTTDAVVRFTSMVRPGAGDEPPAPVELVPEDGTVTGELQVTIPDQAAEPQAYGSWTPGYYGVAIVVQHADQPRIVSPVGAGLALAPTITVTPNATGGAVGAGTPLTVTCVPRVLEGQPVQLLFGSQPLVPDSRSNPAPGDPNIDTTPTQFGFTVPSVPAGTYVVRLRVDGVDSVPWELSAADQLPIFDSGQQVVVA